MPDLIADRGRIDAGIFTFLNLRYRSPETWKAFFRSPDALAFRKAGAAAASAGSVSSALNEVSERLPIRSNFIGVLDERSFRDLEASVPVSSSLLLSEETLQAVRIALPPVFPVCEFFAEEKAPAGLVLGRTVRDHSVWRNQAFPKLLPFEFLCRFDGDFPEVAVMLSQDPLKTEISAAQALWITGMPASEFQDLLLSAAWIAAWTRHTVRSAALDLGWVRLRFALLPGGAPVLVDAFALEDLGFQRQGVSIPFAPAIEFLQGSAWHEAVSRAKEQSLRQGAPDWRRLCTVPAPALDFAVKARVEEDLQGIARSLLGSENHVL